MAVRIYKQTLTLQEVNMIREMRDTPSEKDPYSPKYSYAHIGHMFGITGSRAKSVALNVSYPDRNYKPKFVGVNVNPGRPRMMSKEEQDRRDEEKYWSDIKKEEEWAEQRRRIKMKNSDDF